MSGSPLALFIVTRRRAAKRVRPNGTKLTDDEIREALRLDFEQTADWRRSKAAEYPEDSRNLEAAALLDKLAASASHCSSCCHDFHKVQRSRDTASRSKIDRVRLSCS